MANLGSSIFVLEHMVATGSAPASNRAMLTDMLLLRGEIAGSIADYDRAEAVAARSTVELPESPASSLAMAKVLSRFHRFEAALEWLDRAQAQAADASAIAMERASVLQAVGRFAEALPIREDAVRNSPDLSNCVALAVLLAEQGCSPRVGALFARGISADRDASPFPLAHALFQRSHVAMRQGELEAASDDLEHVLALLPRHVPAKGHLAEVRLAQGLSERALALAADLPQQSDDPEYLALRAEALAACGRLAEADADVMAARAAYAELLGSRPEAYADHAARFYLHVGKEPCRALEWASLNAALRGTARARKLLQQVEAACLQSRRGAEGGPDAPTPKQKAIKDEAHSFG